MSPNTERMRFWIEQVQEGGRTELIDELVRPGFRNHTIEPGQPDDRDEVHATVAAMHAAFSGLRIEILHCVGDGDLVATHKMFRGRHTGPCRARRHRGWPSARHRRSRPPHPRPRPSRVLTR